MSDSLAEPGELFKTTINEYLENLPEAVHTQLYQSPETCLAIFRLLPSLAKFYIMTLLFQDSPVRSSDLSRWIKQPQSAGGNPDVISHRNPNRMYQSESIHRLKALNLLKENKKQITNPTTGRTIQVIAIHLNKSFRDSFRRAIAGTKSLEDTDVDMDSTNTPTPVPEETHHTGGGLSTLFEDDEKITIQSLDKYCLTKWENILHFMVGSDTRETPSFDVLRLLRFSKLMELPSDRQRKEELDADYDPDFETGRVYGLSYYNT
ncbi:unnamed protein product [Ambrosiozyma monospora]|uniref:Unnamed protein product n=1 Tax=Ambrosiozyma monospora TaxID=43982 RepID=A0ACB5U2T5_AMBMO|nr:unnamed protein product [Ambrosiozyma monospora]